jgi:O-antigen/teichoic acid export membrane protein
LLLSPDQLLRSLRHGTLFLLVARFTGKALLLVFLLVLASRLGPRAFLDLEVISSLINFLIWLFLAATFSIARIGSAFPAGELDLRLKGLLQRTQIPALLTGALISAAIIAAGFFLDQARASHATEIQLIVALFALVQFLYSYLLGFHQARESYRLVGVCYLAPGIIALVAAVLFLFLELGLRAALLVYLAGAKAQPNTTACPAIYRHSTKNRARSGADQPRPHAVLCDLQHGHLLGQVSTGSSLRRSLRPA